MKFEIDIGGNLRFVLLIAVLCWLIARANEDGLFDRKLPTIQDSTRLVSLP